MVLYTYFMLSKELVEYGRFFALFLTKDKLQCRICCIIKFRL